MCCCQSGLACMHGPGYCHASAYLCASEGGLLSYRVQPARPPRSAHASACCKDHTSLVHKHATLVARVMSLSEATTLTALCGLMASACRVACHWREMWEIQGGVPVVPMLVTAMLSARTHKCKHMLAHIHEQHATHQPECGCQHGGGGHEHLRSQPVTDQPRHLFQLLRAQVAVPADIKLAEGSTCGWRC